MHIAPYGSWKSPITSDLIAVASIGLIDVLVDADDVYWVEARPAEAGRHVLARRLPSGELRDVVPAGFNARTRVHEYGGAAVALCRGAVYASSFKDQRLYRCTGSDAPVALTPAPPDPTNGERNLRYAAGVVDPTRNLWIGVREDHTVEGGEPVNALVAVDLERGGAGHVLVAGNDFYMSPRLSPDGKALAWIAWNHPEMPWSGTELWVAAFDGSRVFDARKISGNGTESIVQPEWSATGALYFVSDRTNWWNLYRWEADITAPLLDMEAEFAAPPWEFGLSSYAITTDGRLICAYSKEGLGHLGLLDPGSAELTAFDLPFTEYDHIRVRGDHAFFRAASPTEPRSVVGLNLRTGAYQVLRRSTEVATDPSVRPFLTQPEPISFPTEGHKTAHAFYYPPQNRDYKPPAGELPPLLVKCHGGPTGAASSALDLSIQFWTSRGIAVLDVNYGGSSGFGREYRERLNKSWGIVDVDDCVNAAKYLASEGRVDASRTVMAGGSAGGYTTLACLAFRDYFKGGASLYGIGDLAALARDTHKFESRYMERLVGAYPAERAVYEARSPAFHAGSLRAPVIFFQGTDDRIVPLGQTENMVKALRRNSIAVGYLLYSGEGHGFRQAENIKRTLDAQLLFFDVMVFKVGLQF